MKNADLLARRTRAVPRGVATATPIFAARAHNAELWDEDGKRYIDFAAGIAVLNVGHRHPKVLAAVEAQLKAYTHTAFQVVAYEPYIRLAERLNTLAPIEGDAKTIFFTTGAEATENAVKVARAATGRPGIVAFAGGFHGRTLLSSAMTGKVSPYKKGLGPFPGEIYHLPLPSTTTGYTIEDTRRALQLLFAADLEPERIAAFIVEPIQGEGGFHEPDPALFGLIEEMRERFGILFVADEVQSGFARTGKMFGIEHWPIKPDLITVAKSLAGGFPLSGLIGRAAIMDAIDPGGLGGTYAGSPVACAAAHAVLDIIDDEKLIERADVIGQHIRQRLVQFSARNDLVKIANLRGLGAMLAFDVVNDAGERDGDGAKRLCARALGEGLIILTCGQHGQAIRILVPLTASDAILNEGLDSLERALERHAAEMEAA
jgi:4-aminobutyrate aminotransferase / (S)-3-amino-2-methylpropionate transaminase / 5-aminovalerate transaminase